MRAYADELEDADVGFDPTATASTSGLGGGGGGFGMRMSRPVFAEVKGRFLRRFRQLMKRFLNNKVTWVGGVLKIYNSLHERLRGRRRIRHANEQARVCRGRVWVENLVYCR